MNNLPLISICMLCYNHERYVTQAIKSIFNQSYNNWELIIVDNASTDSSRLVIEREVRNDPRVKLAFLDYNGLPSLGFNYGVSFAKGDYLAIISADDYYAENKLEMQLQYMLEHDLELCFTWVNVVNENSEVGNSEVESWFNRHDVRTKYDILRQFFILRNIINAPSMMITKELFRLVGGHDQRLLQTQDFDLWVKCLLKTDKVAVLQQKLVYYRVSVNGLNLSINKSKATQNRIDFEMLAILPMLLKFSVAELSKVFQLNIDEQNKFQVIYNNLDMHNLELAQFALLQQIFKELGPTCDIRSSLFKFFFEKYSALNFGQNSQIQEFKEQAEFFKAEVKNLNNWLGELEVRCQNYQAEINLQLTEIANYKQQTIDLNYLNTEFISRINSLEKHNLELNTNLNLITSSRSWRLTKPLRKLCAIIRRK